MFWHLYAEEQTVGRCPMVLSMSSQDDLRPRYPMSRRAFVSMVTAGAASTLIQGTAAAAQPLPKAGNVVLVHGLFTDGSSWFEVIPRLQAAGLSVTSVQNPLTTLVASAERVLARQDGRTVLAGHSFPGTIVTEAGVHPNVSALVYVAARAPDAGEDYTALAKTFPTPPATAGIVFDGDKGRLSEAAFLRDFAGDLPESEGEGPLCGPRGSRSQTMSAAVPPLAAPPPQPPPPESAPAGRGRERCDRRRSTRCRAL